MTAYFIYNKYYISEKTNILYESIINEANKLAINMIMLSNSEAHIKLVNNDLKKVDFVLFWDKDIKLARELEKLSYKVFNNSKAIELCDDKSKTYMALKGFGIKMPKTIVSPLLYYGSMEEDNIFIDNAINIIGFPMIVKECFGSYGMQVYIVNNRFELIKKIKEIGIKPFILQEFINTSYGRDIRAEVVGDKVVAAVRRRNLKNDFRANITNGAVGEKIDLTHEQEKMAIDVCKFLNLDFGGIDILYGEGDIPIFCEANSNAYPLNVANITGVNIVKEILLYIKNDIK